MNPKSKLQEEALQKWKNNNEQGTICIVTGGGKTRIGVLAVGRLLTADPTLKALIIVPRTNLRDNEWLEEFVKWDYYKILDRVDIECVNTTYKNVARSYDIIVFDEIHRTLSEEFIAVHSIESPRRLGLTATPPTHNEEYMASLQRLCPIVHTTTLEEAVDQGIISPYKIYNYPVSFTPKERYMYNRFNRIYEGAKSELLLYQKQMRAANIDVEDSFFDLAERLSKDRAHPYHNVGKQFWQGMTLRKQVCYRASKKIDAVIDIINRFDNKWIIFAKSTVWVDELHEKLTEKGIKSVKYHSKMRRKEKEEALQTFKEDDYKIMCSADALREGYNLPKIDSGICASGTSVELTSTQELGRVVRFVEGKQAIFINLYVKGTQEEKWIENKFRNKEVNWINNLNKLNG